jgi:hypothetical protein
VLLDEAVVAVALAPPEPVPLDSPNSTEPVHADADSAALTAAMTPAWRVRVEKCKR